MKKIYFAFLLLLLIMPFKVKAITENPLTKLEVETKGGTGNFDLSGGKKNFTFSLTGSLSYANIIATASDPTYVITGAGKVECKDGANTINVVVTDPTDNSNVTYTINLNFSHNTSSSVPVQKSSDGGTSSEDNPKTGAFANISLIAASTFGGIVLILKSNKSRKLF